MKFLFTLVLIISSYNVFGQFALLKMDLQNCLKCRLYAEKALHSTNGRLPVFIVYPTFDDKTQARICETLDTAGSGVPVLFSDKLYDVFPKKSHSGIYYYSFDGKLRYSKSIDSISETVMHQISDLYDKEPIIKYKGDNYLYQLKNGTIYEYNFQLGDIIAKGKENYSIEFHKDFNLVVKDSLSKHYPGFWDLSEKYRKLYPPNKGHYRMSYFYFGVYDDNVFVYATLPYARMMRPNDTIRLDDRLKKDSVDLLVSSKEVILKFEKGNLKNVYPVEYPINDTTMTSLRLPVFALADDSTFYGNYGSANPIRNKEKKDLIIGKFSLQKEKIKFEKQLDMDVPKTYRDFNLDNSYMTLVAFDYPYFAPFCSNEIYNVSTEKKYVMDTLFGKSTRALYETSAFNPIIDERGKVLRPDAVFYAPGDHRIYLYGNLQGSGYYCSIINEETMKEEQYVKLDNNILSFSSNKNKELMIDPDKKLLYLQDKENIFRSYPLAILDAM